MWRPQFPQFFLNFNFFESLESKFERAVTSLDFELIDKCILGKVDPNLVFADGLTALHRAVEIPSTPLVLRLLSCPDLNLESRIRAHGYTPLHLACYCEHFSIAKLLVNSGANPNSHDALNKNTLHIVANTKDMSFAIFLINSKQVQINACDDLGNSPLHIAIDSVFYPMVKLFLAHGANVNPPSKRMHLIFETVLACYTKSQLEIISLLVKYGIKYKEIDNLTNRNVLHFAAIASYIPLIFKLLQLGCNTEHRDNCQQTPSDIALVHGHELASFLIKNYKSYRTDEYFVRYFSNERFL